jgi:hypothetical protein
MLQVRMPLNQIQRFRFRAAWEQFFASEELQDDHSCSAEVRVGLEQDCARSQGIRYMQLVLMTAVQTCSILT